MSKLFASITATVAFCAIGLSAYPAPLGVTAKDRMAMADRLFDKGRYELAMKEYKALASDKTVAEDELLYRLAECERATGDVAASRRDYGALADRFPLSRHANRARLMRALQGTDEEKRAELKVLDSDKVPSDIRASALYHLGVLENSPDMLERSIKLEPKGKYAVYAKFRHASLIADDKDPAVRRSAIRELLEIHFGPDAELAREALYIAGARSYSDKRYSEASTLYRRYLKKYPKDARAKDVRTMVAWSDYLGGKYQDCEAICGAGGTDDADYLLAACAYATGNRALARERMKKYLDAHPEGRYRKAAELPLARMEFEAAGKGDDISGAIEAAKRSASLSQDAADLLRLAWAYEKAGLDAEAVAQYLDVARKFPSTQEAVEALFRKSLADVRAARWSAAELTLAEALAMDVEDTKHKAEMQYWRGVACFMLGHEAQGAAILKEALTGGLSLDQNREARLMLADWDFKEERVAAAKAEYAALVREGACERMGAAKIRNVGNFLLGAKVGAAACEEAAMCARALYDKADTPEWRQAAKILEGAACEADGKYSAAIAAYRMALSEHVRTEDAPEAALKLGILETRDGLDRARADATLREAVTLNADDTSRRATAYLWLARNSLLRGDAESAQAYATVVVTLFDDDELVAEAQKVLDEASKRNPGKESK